MLSIVVLNMAKYTIISLILTDFVPIFFIFNLFRKNLGGIPFQKSPKPQVDFRGGGVNPFQKNPKFRKVPNPFQGGGGGKPISKKPQVQKSPNPARGGSSPLWTNSQVLLLFRLGSFPNLVLTLQQLFNLIQLMYCGTVSGPIYYVFLTIYQNMLG